MKDFLRPYAGPAKVALGILGFVLVSMGVYDLSTMEIMIGSAVAGGTAFWAWYDRQMKG